MEHGRLQPLQQQQSAVSALLTADCTSYDDAHNGKSMGKHNTLITAKFFVSALNSESSCVSTEYNYTYTECNT
jgi:hypothetical protein